jgi:hypothetical protein
VERVRTLQRGRNVAVRLRVPDTFSISEQEPIATDALQIAVLAASVTITVPVGVLAPAITFHDTFQGPPAGDGSRMSFRIVVVVAVAVAAVVFVT